MSINYDLLAPDYQQYRIPDARIAARINHHIPPGSKVLNVGAGQGSYEPEYCDVTAIEPSREMISRRPPASAPAIEGCAENLPFEDNSFDIALAILTIHHWLDVQKGVRELARVARSKVVILTWNGNYGDFGCQTISRRLLLQIPDCSRPRIGCLNGLGERSRRK